MSQGHSTLSGTGITALISNDGQYHFIQIAGVKYRVIDELQAEYYNRAEAKLNIATEALTQIASWNCAGEGIGYDMSNLAEETLEKLK